MATELLWKEAQPMKTVQPLLAIFRDRDTEPVEALLGLLTVVWSVWLLLPGEVGGSLIDLRALMPETVWGLLFLTLGLIKLALLARSNRAARYADLLGAMLWLFVAGVAGLHEPSSTALPVYATLALANVWAFLRRAGIIHDRD